MTQGKFITFEGADGAGKTTQSRLLASRLRRMGIEVVETREPGGSPRAEAIREVILSGRAKAMGPLAETVLFYAARESHLELTIRPALQRGTWIVCDRFNDSTRAYQGAEGVPQKTFDALDHAVVGETRPDVTIVLDLAPEESLRRIAARNKANGSQNDRFEAMNLTFHKSLREEFLAIARNEPGRCAVFDAALPQEALAQNIWMTVRQRLSL